MRALLAIALVALFSADGATAATREASGPLVVEKASAVVTCAGNSLRWEFDVSLRSGIPVRGDGTFAYDGPADEQGSPSPETPIKPTQ